MALGIGGEAGELVDLLKKHLMHNKPLDINAVIKEMGDLEFYLQGLRSALSISRDKVLEANIEKLETRYQEGYSDKASLARLDIKE